MVLELLEWVAPNLLTEPALKPEFNWVVVYELAELPESCDGLSWLLPELDKVSKLAIA